MKKTRKLLLVLIFTLLISSCSGETEVFNNALDADRDAREKMRTAIAKLEEYVTIEAETDEEYAQLRQAALSTARDAYNIARGNWDRSKQLYEKLMDLPGVNPDYLNNYANLLYYQYRMGFDVDLAPGEKALERAIELEDRILFKRNLELLRAVDADGHVAEIRDKNKKLMALLQ